MATMNRTVKFKRQRDALKSARAPLSSSAYGSGIEMVSSSLLGSKRSAYAPLSTEDPGPSRCVCISFNSFSLLKIHIFVHFV